jgi:diadenosine tetraphosphate (Ap4A) HIT family hydrolase
MSNIGRTRCESAHLHRIRAFDELVITLECCDVEKTRAAAHEVLDDAGSAVQETQRVRAFLHCRPVRAGAAAFGIQLLRRVEHAEQLPRHESAELQQNIAEAAAAE